MLVPSEILSMECSLLAVHTGNGERVRWASGHHGGFVKTALLLLTDESLAIKITSTHQNAIGYLTEVAPQINEVKKGFKK